MSLSSDLRKSKRNIEKHKMLIMVGIIVAVLFVNYLYHNSPEFAREVSALNSQVAGRAGLEEGSRGIVWTIPLVLLVATLLLPFLFGMGKYLGILILGIGAMFMFGFDLVKAMVIIAVMILLFNMIGKKDDY